jgi:hypothetical protein
MSFLLISFDFVCLQVCFPTSDLRLGMYRFVLNFFFIVYCSVTVVFSYVCRLSLIGFVAGGFIVLLLSIRLVSYHLACFPKLRVLLFYSLLSCKHSV